MLKPRDREILRWIEEYELLTIRQASILFFNGSYEGARRRLFQLEHDFGKIKSYKLKENDNKVYYISKKSTYHNVLCMDYVAELKRNGCEIIKIKRQPHYMNNSIIPDMYVVFSYKGQVYFTLLELDLYHSTSMTKFQRYEELYKSQELQKENYGQFPILVIAKDNITTKYNSNNFDCIYTDLEYSTISTLLL